MNNYICVRNVHGSSEDHCPCNSWLEWWSKQTGFYASFNCFTASCQKPATDGAHVIDNNGTTYIVPLCHECNMRTDSFAVLTQALVKRY